MLRFIAKIFFFLAPVVVCLILMELTLRHIPNDYTYKKEYLDRHASDLEVFFLGNSHPYFGINPEFIQGYRSFNGAHVGQPLIIDYKILQRYSDKFRELKCLVIPIEYLTLYNYELNPIYKKNYVIYYELDIPCSYTDHIELINGPFKDKAYQLCRFVFWGKNNITCNELGWGTTYKSTDKNDLEVLGKKRAIQHTQPTDIGVKENMKYLNWILSYAESKNLKVIFYSGPAYRSYVENLNASQLNQTLEIVKNIVKENPNVKYYDFLTDARFDKNDFWDGDHLNGIGAKKFTQIIADKLQ